MSRNARSEWSYFTLMSVTTVGMVLGASLFGLYRFVGAESPAAPRPVDAASWNSPGVARPGPTVHVETTPVIPPPAGPVMPVLPRVEPPPVAPPVRQPGLLPVGFEMPVIPTLPPAPVVEGKANKPQDAKAPTPVEVKAPAPV